MSRKKRNILLIIAVAVVFGATAFWVSLGQDSEEKKKVLVVFSDKKERYSFTNYEEAISNAFGRHGLKVDFKFSYLDCDK